MKALCIKQPWASMIAIGEKTIETRLWRTSYRGDLLIVASKNPKIPGFPSGQAIAIATLVDCRPMTKQDEVEACCKVYPGAYSWVLEDIRAIEPFDVKGKPGLFEVKCKKEDLILVI